MTTYGADRDIPNTYHEVPAGFTEGDATDPELRAAGFRGGFDVGTDKPGQQPLDEMLVDGQQVVVGPDLAGQILRESTFKALRDPAGMLVATWDEGRWWTLEESAEFVRQLVQEAAPPVNRAERRARRKKGGA
jgi:hypothetical protein